MAKHGKKRGGLQRRVSFVFKQVSVPQQEGDQQRSTEPTQDGSHSAPSRPKPTDSLVSKNFLMKKVCRSQGSSNKAALGQNVSVPSKRTTPNQTNPKVIEVEESLQAKDLSAQMAPNEKSWIPPKLTTPDHPISKGSPAKKSEQAETIKGEIEPGHKDTVGSQTFPAVEVPTSQTSPSKQSHQAQCTHQTTAPNWAAEAPRISKSEEYQSSQKSESEKRYGSETPQKDVETSAPPVSKVLEEAKAPSLWQQISNKFASEPDGNSTRQKAMMISIPILIIILVFTFRQVLSTSPEKSKGASSEDDALVIKVDSGHEIDWEIPELLPAIMRDPIKLPIQNNTIPTEDPNQTTPRDKSELIDLEAIVYSQDKSSAIINNRIVHDGDIVSGITVLRINRGSVEFELDGEKWIQQIRN